MSDATYVVNYAETRRHIAADESESVYYRGKPRPHWFLCGASLGLTRERRDAARLARRGPLDWDALPICKNCTTIAAKRAEEADR